MAHPGGRPIKYKPEYAGEAKKLCKMGLTDAQLAEFFDVSVVTLNSWKGKHPEFLKSLKVGKAICDDLVERSMYQMAVGYALPEDKVFQYQGEPVIVPTLKQIPADPGAAKSWLANRRPEDWRDKQEVIIRGLAERLEEADERTGQ